MKPLEGVVVQKMGVDKSEEEIRFEGGSISVLINTKRSIFWPSFLYFFHSTFLNNIVIQILTLFNVMQLLATPVICGSHILG